MNGLREMMGSKGTVFNTSHVLKAVAATILCLAVFSSLSPGQGRLSGKNGNAATMDKASDKELQRIQKLAEEGDAARAWWLARMYDPDVPVSSHASNGDPRKQKKGQPYFFKGLTKSYSEAAKWYELAANGGNKAAQSRLGDMYFDQGTGLGDYAKAALWYAKVAGHC